MASIWRTCIRKRPATSLTDQPFSSRATPNCAGLAMRFGSAGASSSSCVSVGARSSPSASRAASSRAMASGAIASSAGRMGAPPPAILGSSLATLGSPSSNLLSVTEFFLREQARFWRSREIAAQLRGDALELDRVAAHVGNPGRLPQHRRVGLVCLQQALRIEMGPLPILAGKVDVRELVEGHRVGRIDLEGTVEIGQGLVVVLHLTHADAGVVQRPGRGLVERIAGGLLEVRQRLLL